MFGARRRRTGTIVTTITALLALTACSGRPTARFNPPPGPGATSASGTTRPGAPAGTAGDPCAVLKPAEVQAAIGQSVRATHRLSAVTTPAAVSQRCQFDISGTGINFAGLTAITTLADTFLGQKVEPQRASEVNVAMIELAVADLPTAATGSSFPSKTLPKGGKRVSGIGQGAVVVSMAKGSIGAALVNPHRAVYVIDLEGRAIPQSQMEKLLKAAVSHAG